MNNQKERLYKENAVQEDLYHFEMGNELGAHLEKCKQEYTSEYQKKSSAEDELLQNPYQNNKE